MPNLPTPPLIPGVTWRHAIRADAPAIAALQDICFVVDDTYREVESEILGRWSDPNIETESDSLLAVTDSGDVVVSLWSVVPTIAETKWRAFGLNYVHPDYRRDPYMSFSLGWWETRARQRISEKAGDLPGVMSFIAYEQEKGKLAFLEANGYAISRYFDEMFRDLSTMAWRKASL